MKPRSHVINCLPRATSLFLTQVLLGIAIFFSSFSIAGAIQNGYPIEAGAVNWSRDFEESLVRSRDTGKPLLVLFQEIPGCIGCRTFGSEVLTQPLLVEAIETEFVPVLVYNNRFGGNDEKLMKRFAEPSWNYQVIRFLDSNAEDIIPRKDTVWTLAGVASRMVQTLEKKGKAVPLYLSNLVLEFDTEKHRHLGFAMACFWTGEYKFGRLDGVVATEAGWYYNREVTLVTYHTEHLNKVDLIHYAEQEQCAQRVYTFFGERVQSKRLPVKSFVPEEYRRAPPADQKKQLERWPELAHVQNLTPLQLARLNGLAPDDRVKALLYLSPKQRRQLEK